MGIDNDGTPDKLENKTNVADEPAHLDRVSIKLPPFWISHPKLWFHSIEAQFKTSGIIDDQTKFYYVVGVLDEQYLKIVGSILENPPGTGKYLAIKDKLISHLSESDAARLQRLLGGMILGDQKPSQLLSTMRMTSNNDLSDQALRNLWLQRLPREMQAILAVSNETLDALAALADKINDVLPAIGYNINQVKSGSPVPSSSKSEHSCCAHQSRQHFRSGNRSRREGSTSSRDRKYCWYHNRFGKKAIKCGEPGKCQYEALNK